MHVFKFSSTVYFVVMIERLPSLSLSFPDNSVSESALGVKCHVVMLQYHSLLLLWWDTVLNQFTGYQSRSSTHDLESMSATSLCEDRRHEIGK